ncbi:thioredoxin-dependent thiol peroxidase [Candidatus Bathyarchaeota archaeon]|nr:thioredoxin-dependent thiol peroxidase [Candidatus Bathyarchaeota archaeon]
MINVGDNAPKFSLPEANGKNIALEELIGKWIILYFYPKDMTSGCTMEALEFTSMKPEFEKEGASIIGISADSPSSHVKFIEKNKLTHTLLSNEDKKTLEAFGVWQTKKMYGKEYKGIVRSTFIINPEGKVAFKWSKVKVQGHADEVLKKLKELKE